MKERSELNFLLSLILVALISMLPFSYHKKYHLANSITLDFLPKCLDFRGYLSCKFDFEDFFLFHSSYCHNGEQAKTKEAMGI
jgi:hypothetical protein